MVPKFAASDHLKISQVEVISECEGSLNLSEVISECEGSLNLSIHMRLTYYFMRLIFVQLTI